MKPKNEMAAVASPVGADDRQSPNNTTNSITDFDEEIKTMEEESTEFLRKMEPSYMETISMTKLFDSVYQSKPPIVEGLLYRGAYLFVGAPKLGKSFLMAQLAYHVSTGTPLWGFPVRQGTVLYLALEDDYRRLQERLYRMFGTAENDNLHFAVSASQIGKGLDDQLGRFIREHPDTSLVIIDTLQKIREVGGEAYSYASDYQIITRMKQIADSYGICLMLVHHTRKQKADDCFDMISGTNGLLGAADGAFLLQKEQRTSNIGWLEISGRDQQDLRLILKKDEETLCWELERAETELWKAPPEPLLEMIAEKITVDCPEWTGSPTELCEFLAVDWKPNVLTQRLNVNASRLMQEYGIRYCYKRSHAGRRIWLRYEQA
jgi:RecA-family ATPase